MSEIATTIASAVEEQGAATREIAGNVQQAAQGTGQIGSNIEGVSVSGTVSPRLWLIDAATRRHGKLVRCYVAASVDGGCQFHGSVVSSSWFLVRPEMIRCRTSVR